jgi:hypothetical protein
MNAKEKLAAAVEQPAPGWAVRRTVEELASAGCSRDEVVRLLDDLLDAIRSETPVREDRENAVLDAYDGIYGWCHPSAWVHFPSPAPGQPRNECR